MKNAIELEEQFARLKHSHRAGLISNCELVDRSLMFAKLHIDEIARNSANGQFEEHAVETAKAVIRQLVTII